MRIDLMVSVYTGWRLITAFNFAPRRGELGVRVNGYGAARTGNEDAADSAITPTFVPKPNGAGSKVICAVIFCDWVTEFSGVCKKIRDISVRHIPDLDVASGNLNTCKIGDGVVLREIRAQAVVDTVRAMLPELLAEVQEGP